MPIIETHATVTVYFPVGVLHPHDFQRAMGIVEGEPDRAAETARRPAGRPHWSLSSKGRMDGDTDDHIRWLLERLETSGEPLIQAVEQQGAEARLWIYWLADNIGPHVWISEDVVKRIARLRLSLHVDAYREVPADETSLSR